jgi:hypothetical protein
MRKNILVVSNSNRRINYDEVLNLYRFSKHADILKIENEIERFDSIVVDIQDAKERLECIRYVRKTRPEMPILLVLSQREYDFTQKIVSEFGGYGRCEIVYYHKKTQRLIQRKLHSLLYPEMPSEREEIAIVMPLYNEELRLELVKVFFKELRKMQMNGYCNLSIYLLNDGSKDNTSKLVENFLKEELDSEEWIMYKEMFKFRQLSVNTKKAGTYIDAFTTIDSDILVYVDADNSFSIEDIGKMINILNQGYYDMVIGTKDKSDPNRPLIRKIMSFAKRVLIKPFVPHGITDSQTGLKAMKLTVVDAILSDLSIDYGLAIDLKIMNIVKKKKFRVLQIPVKFEEQEGSHVEIIRDSVNFIKSIIKISLGG